MQFCLQYIQTDKTLERAGIIWECDVWVPREVSENLNQEALLRHTSTLTTYGTSYQGTIQ